VQPRKVDHVGIAVTSLEQALPLWEGKLGLKAKAIEEVPSQRVKVAFLPLGEVKFELLEATHPESPIAKHVAKRGEGLHHVAFEVGDIRAAMARAKAQGMRTLTEEPGRGAGGKWVCFLHPKDTGSVLVEYVQPA
jgi:methylmalonyl-CoA/ethylmalonyl-CoA epimerase